MKRFLNDQIKVIESINHNKRKMINTFNMNNKKIKTEIDIFNNHEQYTNINIDNFKYMKNKSNEDLRKWYIN